MAPDGVLLMSVAVSNAVAPMARMVATLRRTAQGTINIRPRS